MSAGGKLGELKNAASTFWDARNQRERNMLVAALIVIVVGLFYVLLIDPAVSGRKDLETRLPALRQQAAEVQAMAREASGLAGRASAAPAVVLTQESLEASLARKGIKPQSVVLTGEIAKVQLSAASFAGTIDWLDELRRTAKVSVIDANVEAQAQTDIVNATLTLRQQKSE
ncbi:MAG: type secretion system protein [Noviherbaspirillum sp.]|jgi:general secretion pathway protein M|nr:type secretion system protein [Noviherbaspirillum sp.]